MPGREKTSQQDVAYYSLETNQRFKNEQHNFSCLYFLTLFVFFLLSPLKAPPGHFCCFILSHFIALFFFSLQPVSWSEFIWPLSLSPRQLYFVSFTAPLKWWKSILTRDQDLYDRRRPQLEAHQTHLNGRQKKRFLPPLCLPLKSRWKSAHAGSGLHHSSFIDASSLRVEAVGWGWLGMWLLGGVCRMRMVSPPSDKTQPFFLPLAFYISSIHNKKYLGTDEWLEATSKLQRVFF